MSSSNNSSVLFTVFKHLQEDKDRHEKLNSLLKSFQQADNEKTQIIHALQEKPYLSSLEQEYLNLLRLQCMKDWENTSACGDLCTRLRQQIQVKEEFLSKYNVDEAEADMNMESDEQPIGFAASAEEFFLNGDRGKTNEDQYCKISFLPNNINCCRSFWGVLLGYTENTILWEMHVDAWVRRSLFVHVRLIAKETVPNMTCYAVVPVSFHDDFVEDNWQTNTDFANGSKKPFLAWRHADSVLIPICCPDKYWFHIQYNVDENELTIWNRDEKVVPNVYMQNIVSYYRKNILYFTRQVKNIGRTAVPPPDVEPFAYKKQLTQYPGSKANSAVFLCIIIHKLLRGEHPDAATADVSEEQVTNFRKSMANVLYAKRTG